MAKRHRQSSKEDPVRKDHDWLREHLDERSQLLVRVVTESILLLVILLCVWAIGRVESVLFTRDPQLRPCREVTAPSRSELRLRNVATND